MNSAAPVPQLPPRSDPDGAGDADGGDAAHRDDAAHRADDAAPRPLRTRQLTTTQLGRVGEDLAAQQLQRRGWQIVERNLRMSHGELDIVALEATTLVFIEVKTRRSFVTGLPQAAVTPHKLRRLRRLVGEFLMHHSVPHRDVRIDVIAIHAHPDDTFALEHLRAVG